MMTLFINRNYFVVVGLNVVVAITKEIYDYFHPHLHNVEFMDMAFQMLGCLVAIVVFIIYLMGVKKYEKRKNRTIALKGTI